MDALPRHPGRRGRADADTAALHGFGPAEREVERFSHDLDWMPRVVLLAKSTYVWLDQLSRALRPAHLAPRPDPRRGARHARRARLHRAVADRPVGAQPGVAHDQADARQPRGGGVSAYSLMDYRIADDLGGDEAYRNLRERAWQRGIRLASDMVPNHMGIDSRWVVEHPDWFLSRPDPPYPAYSLQRAQPVARPARAASTSRTTTSTTPTPR